MQNSRHHSPDSAGSSPSHRSQLPTHLENKPIIPVSTGVPHRQSISGPSGPPSGRSSVSVTPQGFSGFNPLIYGNDVDSVDVATRVAMVILFI